LRGEYLIINGINWRPVSSTHTGRANLTGIAFVNTYNNTRERKEAKLKTNLIGSLVMATALFATGASFAATAAGTQPVNTSSADQPGAVYVTTNQDARNEVVAFRRGSDGILTLLQRIDTGGTGTGGPTESQDAVVLNEDHTLLFTVNVSSNDISVFSVDPKTLSSRSSSG